MRLAMAEADAAALGGDVPVGAVLLGPDGAVLAAGHNEREATHDPTAHAEVLALRRAAALRGEWRLTGTTLVVTLEPCVMCAGALVQSRVDRVVYGAVDEKAGAAGSLWDLVRDRRLNHRPEVIAGVLAEECSAQIVRLCVSAGGSITGEHGVGADKAAYMGEMFSETDLETMHWLRCAFDPETRFNPGKVFPTPRLCGDIPGRYVPHPEELSGRIGRG